MLILRFDGVKQFVTRAAKEDKKMSDWWERQGPNWASGQEKLNDNNDGEKEGSKASSLDKIAHNVAGSGRSEQYDAGWRNGVDNPSSDDD